VSENGGIREFRVQSVPWGGNVKNAFDLYRKFVRDFASGRHAVKIKEILPLKCGYRFFSDMGVKGRALIFNE
jgi:hypothetical protein